MCHRSLCISMCVCLCVASKSSPCFPFESTIVRKLNKMWHEGLVIEKYRRLDVSWKSATHVAYFFITRVFHLSTGLRLVWTELRVRPGCSFSWDEKKEDYWCSREKAGINNWVCYLRGFREGLNSLSLFLLICLKWRSGWILFLFNIEGWKIEFFSFFFFFYFLIFFEDDFLSTIVSKLCRSKIKSWRWLTEFWLIEVFFFLFSPLFFPFSFYSFHSFEEVRVGICFDPL